VLEPLDFIARLAALVPRPRLNLTRFHGVFAPNLKHRSRIVPRRQRDETGASKPTAPMNWMQRLKRVFAIDIETCPKCGDKLRVIACIEEPPLIAKILAHVRRREALAGSSSPGFSGLLHGFTGLVKCALTSNRSPAAGIFHFYSVKHTCLKDQRRGLFFYPPSRYPNLVLRFIFP